METTRSRTVNLVVRLRSEERDELAAVAAQARLAASDVVRQCIKERFRAAFGEGARSVLELGDECYVVHEEGERVIAVRATDGMRVFVYDRSKPSNYSNPSHVGIRAGEAWKIADALGFPKSILREFVESEKAKRKSAR